MTACKSNQKNIGTAVEMYSTDYAGHYPAAMDRITPNYLKTIPTCPAAASDTYSAGFVSFLSQDNPKEDLYTMCCQGLHHEGAGISAANYPQYTSVQGLVERP